MSTQKPKLRDDEYIRLIAEVCSKLVDEGKIRSREQDQLISSILLHKEVDIGKAKAIVTIYKIWDIEPGKEDD